MRTRPIKPTAKPGIPQSQPYRLLMEHMSEGAATIAADGTILFCNERLSAMTGIPRGRLVGSPATALVEPAEHIAFQQLLRRAWHGEQRAEVNFLRAVGGTLPVQASLNTISAGSSKSLCLIATDLTDRKQPQPALERERQRVHSVLDNLPVMICLLSGDYDVVYANHAFTEQFGESQGRKCYQYCYGKSQPCEFCESFRVLENGVAHEWEVTSPAGRRLHAFDFPFTDSDGSRLVLEMNVDVTDQREAERKLWEASLYTRSLIEASLDPLVTINPEGKITDVNQATENVTGVDRAALVGSDFCDYFTAPEEARRAWRQAFAQGSVRDYPLAIRHKLGQVTEVLYNANVFRNQKGELEGVFAAARDVTAKKLAETKLRQQAALLDLAQDAIIGSDLEGRILFWNRGAEDAYGWSAHDVNGKLVSDILKAEYPTSRDQVIRILEKDKEWEGELTHTRRDGTTLVVASRWSALRNEDGKATVILEINRDITARKLAENRLQRVNRLLRVLSECTEALMKATDEPSMLQRVCDSVVNGAEYRMAWMGYAQQDKKKSVQVVAQAGFEDGYLQSVNISWGEGARAMGPTGTAIRTGEVMVCADMLLDRRFTPWRENALRLGYRSSIALPLRSGNEIFGALTIYAAETGGFDPREQRLLEELVANVSYAITSLRARTQRQAAQAVIAAEREKFNLILDGLPPYVILLTPDYHVAFANREFRRRFGESGGRKCYEFLFHRTEPCEICETYKVLSTGGPRNWSWTGPDGRIYEIYDFPFTDTDGSKLILEMGIDVTERHVAEEALHASQANLAALFDSVKDPIWSVDREYRLLAFNRALDAHFQKSYGTAARVGAGPTDLLPPERASMWPSLYERAIATGAFVQEYNLPDGRTLDLALNPIVQEGQRTGVSVFAKDVTEQRQAEAARRESEIAFQTLSELVPQLVWMCAPDGANAYFNQRWVGYTGLTLEESYGAGWSKPFHPDDREVAKQAWSRAVATGETYKVESRLRAADGSYRWFLMRGVPTRDASGAVTAWFGTCTDIEDLKRAEEELRLSNEKLEQRVAERTAQLRESERSVRRRLDTILVPEGDLGQLELADILDVTTLQRLMDDFYQLLKIPMFIVDLNGRVLVGVGWQDICTQFHRVHPVAARNCEQSDRELSAGLAAGEFRLYRCKNNLWDVATPIMVGDRHLGNLFTGQFLFTDEKLDEEVFRAQAATYGFDEQQYLAALRRIPRLERETVNVAMAFLVKFAQLISQLSYSSIKAARSATEIGRVNTELASSVKELEAFSYAVAHDLRAPLRHIHGFSDILQRDASSNLSADGHHCLECIVQGTGRMERLLEDLLNLSRLGRQAVHIRPVPLNELVEDVIHELAPDTRDRLIEWQVAALPVAPCDRSLLKIVLTNLLANAVKFTRRCTTAVIAVGIQESNGETAIFVRDNGAGFDMKYAGKLFGVFQRLHGDKDYEGTGIGLATVRRILQKHGGRIWAEGEVGKGATFYFTLGSNSLEEEQPQPVSQEAV